MSVMCFLSTWLLEESGQHKWGSLGSTGEEKQRSFSVLSSFSRFSRAHGTEKLLNVHV